MNNRKPYHSVNFITAHDGFTLRDLVSYNGKHNMANGEFNNDGSNDNLSWNCGAEGETGDQGVQGLRWRQMKNFQVALMVSQGTPMMLMGDEYGHTRYGNNNTYGPPPTDAQLSVGRARGTKGTLFPFLVRDGEIPSLQSSPWSRRVLDRRRRHVARRSLGRSDVQVFSLHPAATARRDAETYTSPSTRTSFTSTRRYRRRRTGNDGRESWTPTFPLPKTLSPRASSASRLDTTSRREGASFSWPSERARARVDACND